MNNPNNYMDNEFNRLTMNVIAELFEGMELLFDNYAVIADGKSFPDEPPAPIDITVKMATITKIDIELGMIRFTPDGLDEEFEDTISNIWEHSDLNVGLKQVLEDLFHKSHYDEIWKKINRIVEE